MTTRPPIAKTPRKNPRWNVEVTLTNGTKTVLTYTARQSSAARTTALHREDVQTVGQITLASS
jgi:hypothetical protein